jgi:hypothetical protein
MFQFTGLPSVPYGFRHGHARITTRRFPHSEIPGSKVGQHLPRAFRSRPRPSSAPGAKASTVCPSSLDHEEHRVAAMEFSRCASKAGRAGLSKLNSVERRGRRCSRRARAPDGEARPEPDRKSGTGELNHRQAERPTGVMAPESLERR